MAKRYHQSRLDRKDESRGMKLRERYDQARETDKQSDQRRHDMKKRRKDESGYHRDNSRIQDYFSLYGARDRMEDEGSDMIYEDHREVANLPHEVMFKEYPKTPYDSYNLNDNIKGIDVQIRDDVRGARRKSGESYPDKW